MCFDVFVLVLAVLICCCVGVRFAWGGLGFTAIGVLCLVFV